MKALLKRREWVVKLFHTLQTYIFIFLLIWVTFGWAHPEQIAGLLDCVATFPTYLQTSLWQWLKTQLLKYFFLGLTEWQRTQHMSHSFNNEGFYSHLCDVKKKNKNEAEKAQFKSIRKTVRDVDSCKPSSAHGENCYLRYMNCVSFQVWLKSPEKQL